MATANNRPGRQARPYPNAFFIVLGGTEPGIFRYWLVN